VSVEVWVRARWGLGLCKTPSGCVEIGIFPCKSAVLREKPGFLGITGRWPDGGPPQGAPDGLVGHGTGLVERRPRLLIRHLEEKEKRQLLHIIAVGQTVIAENVAIIPKLLDECGGVAHGNAVFKPA